MRIFTTTITGLLLLCASSLPVQNRNIEIQRAQVQVTDEDKEDGSFDLNAEAFNYGTYTVVINFDRLVNLTGSGIEYVRSAHSGDVGLQYKKHFIKNARVVTLKPINPTQSSGLSYSYNYIRGRFNPKVEKDFVYRMPCDPGKEIRVITADTNGSDDLTAWKTAVFNLNEGDMVYAARKGVVVEIIDKYDAEGDETEEASVIFQDRGNLNSILVEHEDGTLGQYRGIKKDSFLAKEGETVYPDSPLGIVGKRGKNPQVQFYVYYIITNDRPRSNNSLLEQFDRAYLAPVFETSEGPQKLQHAKTYTSAVNDQLITKEMTKREIKQRTK